jgi:hypothetical protein
MKVNWNPRDAFARARRRSTPWRVAMVPIGMACAIVVFVSYVYVSLHALLYLGPRDAFFCTPTRIASIVLLLVLLVLAFPPGMIITNCLFWLIPRVRNTLYRTEASAGQSFSKANTGLFKAFLALACVLLPIWAVAIDPTVCISKTAIYKRSWPLASMKVYPISHIAKVVPVCSRGSRGGWNIALLVTIDNDRSVDLAAIDIWYKSFSNSVLAVLQSLPWDYSRITRDCPEAYRKLISPIRG